MNYRIVGKTLGSIMLVEAVCLAFMSIVSLIYKESPMPFVWTILILLFLGTILVKFNKTKNYFSLKGAYVTVVLAWLTLSVFGSLPFAFSGYFDSYIDCFFESVSGFTTTGSTVLSNVEALPKGILMWRSFTQFLGGMGILVLTTALFPTSRDRSHFLMRAEVPGPTSDKLVPKLAESSKILYGIYISLTLIECIILLCTGMSFYDALCLSFSTAGTGGFSVYNTGAAYFDSTAVNLILSTFMLLFSINFSLYFLMITKRIKQALKNNEFLFFIGFVAASVLLMSVNINGVYDSFSQSLMYSYFTVSAIVSSTGFGLEDFNLWPTFSKMLIILLMVCGACSGSTGGGIKCNRIMMALKSIHREIKQILHPRSVNIVRMDGKAVDSSTLTSVLRFIAAYFIILLAGILIISLENFDFTTTFTSVLTCLGNVGPGLNLVGPTETFKLFSDFSKIILSICMLIGRLEIFPILVFLSPSTWKRT